MKVVKVFNNNVVLAAGEDDAELVVLGRGVGFGAHPGDDVDAGRVERTFHAAGSQRPERLAALLADIPAEHVAVTEDVVALARAELGDHVGDHVVVPLADHLSFALRRAVDGVEIAYPLRGEVLHVYPREVAVSRRAIAVVHERLGVRLPDVEAIPLALHFVNAQLDSPDLARVVQVTEAFGAILGEVGSFYGMDLDEDDLDVARFVTHLRYFARRQERGELHRDSLDGLHQAFRASNPRELECAERVGALLRDRYGWTVGQDEELFLALHIGRLTTAEGRR